MNRDALIYCAGILDGEGSISAVAGGQGATNGDIKLNVVVAMSDKSAVDFFAQTFDLSVQASPRPDGYKTIFRTSAHGSRAGKLLESLLPWLRTKAARATLAIELAKTYRRPGQRSRPEVLQRRLELAAKIVVLNQYNGRARRAESSRDGSPVAS